MIKNRTSVSNMALYSDLTRARAVLSKAGWTVEDTEKFAHMHYLGKEALDNAAIELGLMPGQTVLDIGSGFGGTGRYFSSRYKCETTGIELQSEIADIAETINKKYNERFGCEVVKTITGDFLRIKLDQKFDCAISLLVILHIPLSERKKLFTEISQYLKPVGKIYIEDFYKRNSFSGKEERDLDKIVSCPGLPTREEYISALEKAGFDVKFEDVTEVWSNFVAERSDAYAKSDAPGSGMLLFYRTISSFFNGGNLGGARITSVKV